MEFVRASARALTRNRSVLIRTPLLQRFLSRSAFASSSAASLATPPPKMRAAVKPAADMVQLRTKSAADISRLTEVKQATRFLEQLKSQSCQLPANAKTDLAASGMSAQELKTVISAGMLTFLTHVESRTSSLLGQGPHPYLGLLPCLVHDHDAKLHFFFLVNLCKMQAITPLVRAARS